MSETRNLGLPFLAAGQAQKHVTVNEALTLIDQLVHIAVAREATLVPPQEPEEGERHVVGPGAEGAFQGHDGALAMFTDGAWRFAEPRAGWVAYARQEGALLVHDGAGWRALEAGGGESGGGFGETVRLARLGIGTDADAENPFAAKLNNALWTAREAGEGGSGDLRYTMSKEAPARTLSLLFQSGYEGRAEIGLVGDDDLTLKVSADGAEWREALRIDRGSGRVFMPSGAGFIEPEGRCRLERASAEEIRLVGRDGAALFVAGANRAIAAGGVSLANDGLAAGTLYYVYARIEDGQLVLEAATDGHERDAEHGHRVRTGDPAASLVGMVRTDGQGRFVDAPSARLVRSWFNPGSAATIARLGANRSTTSQSFVELHPEIRNEVLLWEGEAWRLASAGGVIMNTLATHVTSIGVDGVQPVEEGVQSTCHANGYRGPASLSTLRHGLGEGYHFATLLGRVFSGTGTWIGQGGGERCALMGDVLR